MPVASGSTPSVSTSANPSALTKGPCRPRLSTWDTYRSTRSTLSSVVTTTFCLAASPTIAGPICIISRALRSLCSSIGRMRSPCANLRLPLLPPPNAPTPQEAGALEPGGGPEGLSPRRTHGPGEWTDHNPGHRRRSAGRKGVLVGEPQTQQRRSPARVLERRGDDLRANGHAQDVRTDRPAFRLDRLA